MYEIFFSLYKEGVQNVQFIQNKAELLPTGSGKTFQGKSEGGGKAAGGGIHCPSRQQPSFSSCENRKYSRLFRPFPAGYPDRRSRLRRFPECGTARQHPG